MVDKSFAVGEVDDDDAIDAGNFDQTLVIERFDTVAC